MSDYHSHKLMYLTQHLLSWHVQVQVNEMVTSLCSRLSTIVGVRSAPKIDCSYYSNHLLAAGSWRSAAVELRTVGT